MNIYSYLIAGKRFSIFHVFFYFLWFPFSNCLNLDITNKDSIYKATALIQDGILDYYDGTRYGGTPGMFVYPYYWWEAGAAFGSLLDNWYLTGNKTYESLLMTGMLHQTGKDNDYIPSNQSMTEGNDDQGFWGLTVMAAVERNFTNPGKDDPQWLYLAQAVYNTINSRWDTQYCSGGLRWQIFTWNSGYDYKNTISNGCLFHMAARLARYTSNETYIETADRVWEWITKIGFVSSDFMVYDGADISTSCTTLDKTRWSYNFGIYLSGAAYLYNFTQDPKWETIVTSLLENNLNIFFNNDIMYESACQNSQRGCNNDQRCFKALLSRFLGMTSILVPSTYNTIRPLLEKSAAAAALSCSGGKDGHTCGLNWETGSYDGNYGLGEQMSALEAIQSLLLADMPAPFTAHAGGSSEGSQEAGLNSGNKTKLDGNALTITTKDKAGAAVLTAIALIAIFTLATWMIIK